MIGVVPLGPAGAEAAAAVHEGAAEDGDRWDAAAISALLAMPGTFGFLAGADSGAAAGFVLARAAADEAEILYLAVRPAVRGGGIGSRLLEAAAAEARRRGAARLLLEVAVDNVAARALYANHGLAPIGRRADYYRRASGIAVDALVLGRPL